MTWSLFMKSMISSYLKGNRVPVRVVRTGASKNIRKARAIGVALSTHVRMCVTCVRNSGSKFFPLRAAPYLEVL